MRKICCAVGSISLIVACSGGGDPSAFTASGGLPPVVDDNTGSNDDSTGLGFDLTNVPDTVTCESQTLCGATAKCCAIGEECVEGACATTCTSGVRCASTCCDTGDVCLSEQCVAPGAACGDSFDCGDTEFCEPTLRKCLPQPVGASACEFRPEFAPLAPVVEWSWTDSAIHAGFNQVINTPIVLDLDADGTPEVIVVTSKDGAGSDANFSRDDPAFLRALDGKTGVEKWTNANADVYKDGTNSTLDYRVNPRATPAVGDIDGDGQMEIIAVRRSGGLIAFRADGSLKWVSTTSNGMTPHTTAFDSATVALADLDNDGKAEVIVAGMIFDDQGRLVNDSATGREAWGANQASYGPVSIVADVDGDALTTEQYVVTGNRAIRKNGTLLWDVSATVTDGYAAISDLDGDGIPELVVTAQGTIRVQNALTGAVLASLTMPGTGRGGPPTIADFDKDGTMELASANGTAYSVFEYDPDATPKLSVKWSVGTQDGSSNVTGSSVFDFEGDGAAEVVYNDECYLRVYKGTTGEELFKVANSSATIHENPVLVDVDGDNNTEFVVGANDRNHLHAGLNCGYPMGTNPRHGVFVYGDMNDKWVRTRKIWNQHAYHITNVDSSGRIPAMENRSWAAGENNNYRVSAQGKGAFNAPDLRVDLSVSTQPCPAGIELRARVKNAGSLGVAAGVRVAFYSGPDNTGTLLHESMTTKALLPGESELVTFVVGLSASTGSSFFVNVDGSGTAGVVNECSEGNNGGAAGSIACPEVK